MKPMLACSTIPDLDEISYPVLASPKLDGIRAINKGDGLVSRNFKLIPNAWSQKLFGSTSYAGLDGELMSEGDFSQVESTVMSQHGSNKLTWFVFDCFDEPKLPYSDRLSRLSDRVSALNDERVIILEQKLCETADELEAFWSLCIAQGFEGAIVRDPAGPYKFGRSTLRQGWMMKLKKFIDAEATVIGYTELEHNYNEAETDKLGAQVRSKHQANMVAGGTLGALICEYQGEEFKVGTGFTQAERHRLWAIKDKLIGMTVTFKFQELTADKKPRFPSYKGLRRDL